MTGRSRLVCLALALTVGVPSTIHAKKRTFKIATLAPEGSTWWKIFTLADRRLRELSDNRMRIKLYAGGVVGDEPDAVRKMRVGQLHGAAVTSVGLAEIAPALLVLQAPGLFKTWEELDAVRVRMGDRFKEMLEAKGFSVLLWGDVGFNRLFSTSAIQVPSDLRSTRPWCWTQDAVAQATYEAAGATPVLLGVGDVLPGLQTGLVNAYSTPPLVAVSLQWHSRVKHMLDLPLSATIGAVLVRKKTLDELTAEERRILDQLIGELLPKLYNRVRDDDAKAITAVKSSGVSVSVPSEEARNAWAHVSRQAAEAAVGKVYPRALLDEVRRHIAAYRARREP